MKIFGLLILVPSCLVDLFVCSPDELVILVPYPNKPCFNRSVSETISFFVNSALSNYSKSFANVKASPFLIHWDQRWKEFIYIRFGTVYQILNWDYLILLVSIAQAYLLMIHLDWITYQWSVVHRWQCGLIYWLLQSCHIYQ